MQRFRTPNFRRVGQSTIVLECEAASIAVQRRLWALAREARGRPHIAEAVVGAGNLTLAFDWRAVDYETLRGELESAWEHTIGENVSERTIEIPVRYGSGDGPDLQAVAQACGL
ncbi:MAG: carboxyltransferase domain-containing protein, partial [Candidatus Sulfotelmatobacter sp.]